MTKPRQHTRQIMLDINVFLHDSIESKYFRENFFCAIPRVDLVKELYQKWIRLSTQHQRTTIDLFLTEIMSDPYYIAPSSKLQRLAYYLIKAFNDWTWVQNYQGACGVDLIKFDLFQENELYRTVTLVQEGILQASPMRSRKSFQPSPPSSSPLTPIPLSNKTRVEQVKSLARGDTPLASATKCPLRKNKDLGCTFGQSSGQGDGGVSPSNRIFLTRSFLAELDCQLQESSPSSSSSSSSSPSATDEEDGSEPANESSADETEPGSLFTVSP